MSFDTCFAKLIGFEGGYQCDKMDRGNWTGGVIGQGELKGTKFGISAASYPELDIPNLTLEKAKEIYLLDYWNRCGCDLVSDAVAYCIFDMAVNSGRAAAIKAIQTALGIQVDGIFGDQTRAHLQGADQGFLFRAINGSRLSLMTSVDDNRWLKFGRGWVNRVANILKAV